MEGFTLGLALVDAVPVICFAAGMALVAARFGSPLFAVGALLSVLAGCCKVAWKLLLAIRKKDAAWLNRPFVPMQAAGFLLMLLAVILNFSRISWAGVLAAVTTLPAPAFFLAWIALMGFMGWYRRHGFRKDDARSNWTAQLVNAAGQLCLLLGVLFAVSGR